MQALTAAASTMHAILQMLASTAKQRVMNIQIADTVFLLAATIFFYCGHVFGLQRNGPTLPFPGKCKANMQQSLALQSAQASL